MTLVLTARSDAKRSADNDVNWKAVAYDLNDVNWEKVNWSSVFTSPTPTATAEAKAAVTPAAYSTVEQKTSAKATPTSSADDAEIADVKVAEYKVSSAAPATTAATSSKAAATTSSSNGLLDAIEDLGDVVHDVLEGVESIVKSLGIISTGKNDKSSNGGIWIGEDGDWKAEFTNDANEDAVIFCWKADGFDGMSLNVNQPEVSVGLKSGKKTVVSFAPGVPAACAPAFSDTKLANFGGLHQTWWEVTFGVNGAFDVSRNINMNGRQISSKGSKCVSDMDNCVFKCLHGLTTCEKGTDYDLFNCGASSGGGGGYDAVMAGTGGGCSMGHSGETVKVTFS